MKKDQIFLVDGRVIDRIISYGNVSRNDRVLEIGAGYGNLTRKLADKASKVYAIEKDKRLAEILSSRIPENVEVIQGDARYIDFPPFDKVISNIPYSISSQITFKLLSYPFLLGILTYQYEFAKRMVAKPKSKDYSRLSVMTQYHAKVRILEKISPSAFFPKPNVTSAIVELIPSNPKIRVKDPKFFSSFLSTIFAKRRKKLKNALEIDLDFPEKERRAGELTPEELANLANRISS
jgi:16S rRNA (adenine1518-N6/adenine1519-N6)-dimethyltransferase